MVQYVEDQEKVMPSLSERLKQIYIPEFLTNPREKPPLITLLLIFVAPYIVTASGRPGLSVHIGGRSRNLASRIYCGGPGANVVVVGSGAGELGIPLHIIVAVRFRCTVY
jgi:hypothetical protein